MLVKLNNACRRKPCLQQTYHHTHNEAAHQPVLNWALALTVLFVFQNSQKYALVAPFVAPATPYNDACPQPSFHQQGRGGGGN